MNKCKCGRERDTSKRAECCEPDCHNPAQNVRSAENPFYRAHRDLSLHTDKSCCVCWSHHKKMNDHFGGYLKYRGDECSNVDGRLGFKCKGIKHMPKELRLCALTVDHKDEFHDHDPKKGNSHIWVKNLQDFCANCHAIKTQMIRYLPQYEKQIRFMLSFAEHSYDTDDECIEAMYESRRIYGKGTPKVLDKPMFNLFERTEEEVL